MKRTSLPARAVRCAVAAALACTLNPISAFADSGISGPNIPITDPTRTNSVGTATDEGEVNVAAKKLLQANEPTVQTPISAYGNNPNANINVTAPLKLYFGGESGTLDLADLGKDRSITADAKISNNGDYYDIVLESMTVKNEGLDQVLKVKTDADDAHNSILTKPIFSVKDSDSSTAEAMSFAAKRDPKEGESGLQDYELTAKKDDTGVLVASNSTESCEFKMDLKDLAVTDSFKGTFEGSSDEVRNGLDKGRALISVVCTFDATSLGFPSYELNSSGYTNSGLNALIENAKKEDFFLQVTDPTHVDYLRVYSLAEVKAHANVLSADETHNNNKYKSYFNFAKGDSAYDCKIKANASAASANADLTIIGVCQNRKADGTGFAGLTFYFSDILKDANGNNVTEPFGTQSETVKTHVSDFSESKELTYAGLATLRNKLNGTTNEEPYETIHQVLGGNVAEIRRQVAAYNEEQPDDIFSDDKLFIPVAMNLGVTHRYWVYPNGRNKGHQTYTAEDMYGGFDSSRVAVPGTFFDSNKDREVGGQYIYYYFNSGISDLKAKLAKGSSYWVYDCTLTCSPDNKDSAKNSWLIMGAVPPSGSLSDDFISVNGYTNYWNHSLGIVPAFCL